MTILAQKDGFDFSTQYKIEKLLYCCIIQKHI